MPDRTSDSSNSLLHQHVQTPQAVKQGLGLQQCVAAMSLCACQACNHHSLQNAPAAGQAFLMLCSPSLSKVMTGMAVVARHISMGWYYAVTSASNLPNPAGMAPATRQSLAHQTCAESGTPTPTTPQQRDATGPSSALYSQQRVSKDNCTHSQVLTQAATLRYMQKQPAVDSRHVPFATVIRSLAGCASLSAAPLIAL